MHPYALLLSHLYLSDLRRDAAAYRVASERRDAARWAGPGRLVRLRRALGSISGPRRGRSLDLPAAA